MYVFIFFYAYNIHNSSIEISYALLFVGGKNKGFRMLEKMGWEGGGLGRAQGGIQEPIHVEQRAKQAGLGTNISIQVSKRDKN